MRSSGRRRLRGWGQVLHLVSPLRQTNAADAGSPGVGRYSLDRNVRPIEIIMACEAGRISIGEWS